ncbi:DUF3300 domain-containing protein [Rubrimonas cliftonensis]|uniref:DUF3300 domain-containing protein n=1 Tax=Rubrimonas cliftonensis TaxID=89524 RepID=A0A1H3YHG8_9RHOB|nr:DUF3300 domain-containing protein [Rubrimonas cliftonensis]SEA10993.1 Protein of unknown function [Rubrimonas cliftonensis]
MRTSTIAATGALLLGLAAVVASPGVSRAQDDAAAAEAGAEAGTVAPLADEETLDALVAPVALYPDALLAQVLVAATYPLDVVKADRWSADNAELADDARADAAQGEGWDPSVAVLAAGFPTVIARMAADLDATEALGEAVLAQTDAVMDAVQRQRGRAAAVGNLESNPAQTVTETEGTFAIAPADPEVVYVPAYNADTVYTQAAAAPVVVADPDDEGYSSGELVATGVVAFGAGMLINELFDDDDDWDDYWRGPPRVDWDGGDFYPRPGRPGINAGGDVNIDIDRGPSFSAIRDDADGRPDRRGAAAAGPARDRVGGARPAAGGGDRAAARAKIAARSDGPAAGPGAGGAGLRDRAGEGAGGALGERAGAARAERGAQGGGTRAAVARAGGGREGAAQRPRPKISAGGGARGGALRPGGGGRQAKAAKARGGASGGGRFGKSR